MASSSLQMPNEGALSLFGDLATLIEEPQALNETNRSAVADDSLLEGPRSDKHSEISSIGSQDAIAVSMNLTPYSSSQGSPTTDDSLGTMEADSPEGHNCLRNPSKRASNSSESNWEQHRPDIARLYRYHTLDEVMKRMQDDHKFIAR